MQKKLDTLKKVLILPWPILSSADNDTALIKFSDGIKNSDRQWSKLKQKRMCLISLTSIQNI